MKRVWLLDLDNTLHDARPVVFPRINQAMTDYVARALSVSAEEASALRAHYWRRYGATLLGLVRHHGIDAHHFLRETHSFPDLERIVRRDHRLIATLKRLPGRRVIVTNSPRHYAMRVVRALGIGAHVDEIVSIESMRFAGRFQPKPSRAMLRRLAARLGVPPYRCVLVEDTLANLASARSVRMRTVLVTGIGVGVGTGTGTGIGIGIGTGTGTGLRVDHGHRPPADRPRTGLRQRVDLQVRSVAHLPRRIVRTPFFEEAVDIGEPGGYHAALRHR